MSLNEALQSTRKALRNLAQVSSWDTDTTLLLSHILGLDSSTSLYTLDLSQTLTAAQNELLASSINRLIKGEPLAYVIGKTEFYGHNIEVNSSVLIPRVETEGLVDLVLAYIATQPKSKLNILEIGLGSGAIAIAVCSTLREHDKSYSYTGIDISETALKVANANINSNLHLKTRKSLTTGHETAQEIISTLAGTMTEYAAELKNIDILVSNPPYLTAEEVAATEVSVRDYEPHLALVGGDDGLEIYREIRVYLQNLDSKPALFLEINPVLVSETRDLFKDLYQEVSIKQDVFGRDRFLVAT